MVRLLFHAPPTESMLTPTVVFGLETCDYYYHYCYLLIL
jgi:hypothetical protein